jgi:hypothetical protein
MHELTERLTIARSAQAGYLTQFDDAMAPLVRSPVGDLVITSGSVIACDPLGELRDGPFAAHFPSGRYPVVICVAMLPTGLNISVYAEILFVHVSAVSWEVAHLRAGPSADVSDRYFVDSGTGCFMDQDCLPLLAARFTPTDPDDPFRRRLVDRIYDEPSENRVGTLHLRPDPSSELNCIMFATGWGDDWYPSYLGRDAAGAICSLLTEFVALETQATVQQ